MDNEILNNNSNDTLNEKEILRKRKEQQIELAKKAYNTDAKEKEEALIRMKQEEELEKELAIFYSIRKFLIGMCGFMWLFAAFCLVTGSLEMSIFLPLCLGTLAATAGINAPIFLKKKKYFDSLIAIAAAVVCFLLGVIIFTMG